MRTGLGKIVTKIPGIHYIMGNFIQRKLGRQNATVFSYKANFENNNNWQITKIDKNRDLFIDRLLELTTFYNISLPRLICHYLRNGTPNSNYYRSRMMRYFDILGKEKESLYRSYEVADFMYANRLLLRCHNYNVGKKILNIFERLNPPSLSGKISVLDYGCGVADASLYLALHGANVTIVDLDNKKFEFAQARFHQRNLEIEAITTKQTEMPIELPIDMEFDVVIMAEFLEHVSSPRRFLEFALSHLDDDGILYNPLGPVHNHGVGGDHLEEAKLEMETTDYKEYFTQNLEPINSLLDCKDFKHFYVKR